MSSTDRVLCRGLVGELVCDIVPSPGVLGDPPLQSLLQRQVALNLEQADRATPAICPRWSPG
eukprot:4042090-Pyramimonas_sp.AAC.1